MLTTSLQEEDNSSRRTNIFFTRREGGDRGHGSLNGVMVQLKLTIGLTGESGDDWTLSLCTTRREKRIKNAVTPRSRRKRIFDEEIRKKKETRSGFGLISMAIDVNETNHKCLIMQYEEYLLLPVTKSNILSTQYPSSYSNVKGMWYIESCRLLDNKRRKTIYKERHINVSLFIRKRKYNYNNIRKRRRNMQQVFQPAIWVYRFTATYDGSPIFRGKRVIAKKREGSWTAARNEERGGPVKKNL
ncbi:hypothetical protein V1478_014867 [Vespula squamosa]|uniref:Uncharacterized protein n=1 Tax=Vespula squamosa TaxID=30214 RepID=A0ABD2A3G9_VESSQ